MRNEPACQRTHRSLSQPAVGFPVKRAGLYSASAHEPAGALTVFIRSVSDFVCAATQKFENAPKYQSNALCGSSSSSRCRTLSLSPSPRWRAPARPVEERSKGTLLCGPPDDAHTVHTVQTEKSNSSNHKEQSFLLRALCTHASSREQEGTRAETDSETSRSEDFVRMSLRSDHKSLIILLFC